MDHRVTSNRIDVVSHNRSPLFVIWGFEEKSCVKPGFAKDKGYINAFGLPGLNATDIKMILVIFFRLHRMLRIT